MNSPYPVHSGKDVKGRRKGVEIRKQQAIAENEAKPEPHVPSLLSFQLLSTKVSNDQFWL